MITFLFLLLAVTVLVFLAALWRTGLRAEVFRLVVVSVILFTGDHLMRASSMGTGILVCVTCAVICALVIRQRPGRQATAPEEPDDVADDETTYQPDAQYTRYDSDGLADHVRRQMERKAS